MSFFKRCVKEDGVAAVFMFELTLFQIFGPSNDILFCPLFILQRVIFNAICNLVSQVLNTALKLNEEDVNNSFDQFFHITETLLDTYTPIKTTKK